MRGPRLSFPEDFRETWDKENKDPVTQKFSPRTKRTRTETALQEITVRDTEKGFTSSRHERVTWLDNLLDV